MNARRWPLRAVTGFLGLWTLGLPAGLAAHAPQEDVIYGRVEVREAPSAWLGVKFQHVVTDDSSRVVLASIFPNSPAARAGLEAGDRLLRVNGKVATMDLMSSLGPRIEAGDPFTFTVLRSGRAIEASLVAEPRPESGDIIVTRMQTQLDSLGKRIRVSLDSLERAGLAGLPSLEVRRVDGDDGSFSVVVATSGGTVTLSEGVLADVEATWADAEHFAAAWIAADSTRTRAPFPLVARGLPTPRAEAGRVEVRIDAREGDARTIEPRGWTISGPLSPWEEGARRVAGAELHPVGPDLGRYLGTDSGLLITEVTPGTPAALAGLKPGDVLRAVDDVALESVGEFRELLTVPSRERSLTVVRDGAEVLLTLRR